MVNKMLLPTNPYGDASARVAKCEKEIDCHVHVQDAEDSWTLIKLKKPPTNIAILFYK